MGRRSRRERHKIGPGLLPWASLLPSIPCRPCAIHSSIYGGGCVVYSGTESGKIEAIETTFDTLQLDGPDG